MKQQDENNTIAWDFKYCPKCGSNNFTKGHGADIEKEYRNGKLVRKKILTIDQYSSFLCDNCGWQRTDVS